MRAAADCQAHADSHAACIPRTWGQAGIDATLAFSRGSNALVGGLAGLPVDALNFVNQFSPANLTPASWGLRPPVVSQPHAVRDFQDFLRRDSQREMETMMSEKGKRQMAEFEDVHGFMDTVSYLAANPSFFGTTAVEQLPQLALAIPGRLRATIALQSSLAGSMNESETAGELAQSVAEGTMTQTQADRRAAEVFTGTALLNAATAGLPGAQTLERLASGKLARVPAARATGHVATAFAGEAAQEGATEAGEQILQNIATDKPWNQDAGKMGALGAMLDGTLGGAGGGLEAIGSRGLHGETAPPQASEPAPADVLKAAIEAVREPHAAPHVVGEKAETAPRQTTENTAETQKPVAVEHPRGIHETGAEADIDALLMDAYALPDPAAQGKENAATLPYEEPRVKQTPQPAPRTDDTTATNPVVEGETAGGASQDGADTAASTGAFGPVHDGFRHNANAAVAHLMEHRIGEATAALHHHQVGDIDLIWGEEGTAARDYTDGFGLAKIARKHPEVLNDLQGFISGLEKNEARSGKNRIQLESETGKAAVRLEWDGQQKKWLMTAFVKDANPATTIGMTGVDGRAEPAPPAGQEAGSQEQATTPKDSRVNTKAGVAETLEDFGEKLGGARKDLAARLRGNINEQDIATQPMSKIWPRRDIDTIKDPALAAALTILRDSIPAKPKHRQDAWAMDVRRVLERAQQVISGELPLVQFKYSLPKNNDDGHAEAKLDLLENIGRNHWPRIGRVFERPDASRKDAQGNKVPNPYVLVTIDGKRVIFDNATSVSQIVEDVQNRLAEKTTQTLQFEVRGSARQQAFFINKKGDPDLTGLQHFTSADDAFDFLRLCPNLMLH